MPSVLLKNEYARGLDCGDHSLAFTQTATRRKFCAQHGRRRFRQDELDLAAITDETLRLDDRLEAVLRTLSAALRQPDALRPHEPVRLGRSEESRVGQECGRTWHSRGSPAH